MGCGGTSRTTWSSRRTTPTRAWNPGVQSYGEVRRPTPEMMDTFDVLLVDLQDVGCRIYTFVTTLRYVLEAAAMKHKAVWVLDRPNPVGRPVRRADAAAWVRKFRWRGCDADAARADPRRACTVVRKDAPSRRRLPDRADGGLGAERQTRLWMAARWAHRGSIQVPTLPIFGWHAAIRVR